MEKPLNLSGEYGDLLIWESKKDGMYLTVQPSANEVVDVDSIRSAFIEQKIMNFDLKRVSQVIKGASGRPEYIGPNFVRFDLEKYDYMMIEANAEMARLQIKSGMDELGLEPTVKDVEFLLMQQNIIHGVDWGLISKVINGPILDEFVVIARATMPENGKDAQILEKIKIDPNAKPMILSDGNVDFRNLETIKQVAEGDLIAVRIPPSDGKEGIDIYGTPIKPIPGKDLLLPQGNNTVVTPDKKELRATAAGYVYRQKDQIMIGCLYILNGDVNFKSGNIKYQGDVVIRGNVLTDFEVEASGDVTIEGSIEGAKVDVKGNLIVRNGIFGKDKAEVRCGENFEAQSIQDCKVDVGGDLKIKVFAKNVTASAMNVIADNPNCVVSGSKFNIGNSISCYQLGNRQGGKTEIAFINKETEVMDAKIAELTKLETKMTDSLGNLEKTLRSMRNMLKKVEQVPERSKQELKKVIAQFSTTQKKIEFVKQKKKALVHKRDNPVDLPGTVAARYLMPDLILNMYGFEQVYKQELRDIRFRWANSEIEAAPLESEE